METAIDSSSESPASHSQKPVGIERQADPEPNRAKRESSASLRCSPAAVLPAKARAANAAAEEAMPAPIGKLFWLSISAKRFSPARLRMRSIKWTTRINASPSDKEPFTETRSERHAEEKATVVRVSNAPRFMEIDPFAGKRKESSRFPQYLINAIFGCATAVAAESDICPHRWLIICYAKFIMDLERCKSRFGMYRFPNSLSQSALSCD